MTKLILDQQVVWQQASCVVLHRESGSVVAVGDRALAYLGKNPAGLEVVFPVRHGVIANDEAAVSYLQAVVKELDWPDSAGLSRFQGLSSLSVEASPVDQQVFSQVLTHVGWHNQRLVPQPLAFYQCLPKQIKQANSLCLLNLGAQTIQLALLAAGEPTLMTGFNWGGQDLTQELITVIRNNYQLEIGWLTAEKIKQQLGQIWLEKEPKQKHWPQLAVRGKDIVESTIKTETISARHLVQPFQLLGQTLVDELKFALAQAPADLVAEALSHGLFLTGGTSQLKGLAEYLQQELRAEVHLSQTPQLDVVKGLSKTNKRIHSLST